MEVYKFVQPARIDILRNECIRYTPPMDLNDPFEMSVSFTDLMPQADIEKQFSDAIDDIAKNFPMPEFVNDTNHAVRAFVEQFVKLNREPTLRNLKAMQGALLRRLKKKFPEMLADSLFSKIGVLSLSESYESLLMWAHYACEHRGFVICLDGSHPVFNERRSPEDEFGHLRKVNYEESKPLTFLSDISGTQALLTKSSEWFYEKEWRVIKSLEGFTDKCGIYLLPLPADAIKGVILGARMVPQDRDELLDLVRGDARYNHVWIKEASLQRDKFALAFLNIPNRRTIASVRDDLVITIKGCADGAIADEIGYAIKEIVAQCREVSLDFSCLHRIVVCPDIRAELSTCEGLIVPPPGAKGQVIACSGKETLEVYSFIDLAGVMPLAAPHSDEFKEAIHLVHHELAHVHNVTKKHRMLGSEAMLKSRTGRHTYLHPIAVILWDEYSATTFSSSSASDAVIKDAVSNFLSSCKCAATEILSAKSAYRHHGNLNVLLRAIVPPAAHALECCVYVLAYLGRTKLIDFDRAAYDEISNSAFSESFHDLENLLPKMHSHFPEWEDEGMYDELVDTVEWLFMNFGICFDDDPNGMHVAVI